MSRPAVAHPRAGTGRPAVIPSTGSLPLPHNVRLKFHPSNRLTNYILYGRTRYRICQRQQSRTALRINPTNPNSASPRFPQDNLCGTTNFRFESHNNIRSNNDFANYKRRLPSALSPSPPPTPPKLLTLTPLVSVTLLPPLYPHSPTPIPFSKPPGAA